MKPTQEQQFAVDIYKTHCDMKVIAYAGTGKTSTLVAMAEADEHKGALYIAFNKRIAEEADRKFPFNVRCSTAHSLAFREMRNVFPVAKLTNNPRMLDAKIKMFGNGLTMANCRELVARTLQRFQWSDSVTPSVQHVPDLVKLGFATSQTLEADRRALSREIASRTREVWERMIRPSDALPLGHDGYLKLWAMGKPSIRSDVIMVDEAQDLSPVLISVLKNQFCQIVAVGDSHQQIYEWRGARDALAIFEGEECRLTQSFRFGARIAREANRVLRMLGERRLVTGTAGFDEVVLTQPESVPQGCHDAVLCRSNSGVIANVLEVLQAGRDVFVPGGVTELRNWISAADKLISGSPNLFGDLMAFATWKEVEEFSQTLDGAHMAVMVKLMNRYGYRRLAAALDSVLGQEQPGCLTVSTTHKAKGLEWDSVLIDRDFMLSEDDSKDDLKVHASQLRLLYVAVTRAKKMLSLPLGLMVQYEDAKVIGLGKESD